VPDLLHAQQVGTTAGREVGSDPISLPETSLLPQPPGRRADALLFLKRAKRPPQVLER
jgi:hypothetical protein